MRRLNRKGYLTVEIVIASVLAFSVAFFLMDMTVKLVNDTEDAYVDTILTTDKSLIMKNIKNSIETDIKDGGEILDFRYMNDDENSNYIEIYYRDHLTKCLMISGNKVQYNDCTMASSVNTYEKKLNNKFKNVKLTGEKKGSYVFFKIAGNNIFSDKNYDINIIVYNG